MKGRRVITFNRKRLKIKMGKFFYIIKRWAIVKFQILSIGMGKKSAIFYVSIRAKKAQINFVANRNRSLGMDNCIFFEKQQKSFILLVFY